MDFHPELQLLSEFDGAVLLRSLITFASKWITNVHLYKQIKFNEGQLVSIIENRDSKSQFSI